VTSQDDLAVAASHSVEVDRWVRGFDEVMDRIAGRFTRVETRRRSRTLLLGLLAGLPRTNCWTLAEHAGDNTPDGMQHLLARASWDHDGVRDDLSGYVVEHLGRADAVLVVDETGDLKKGTQTVGVQRQYTGTAGRIENAQVGVYLTYATESGHAFIDRELYLPRSWIDNPARCAEAGVPEDTVFKTKPQLAARMIERALDADTPASWVAGDEVYGNDPTLRNKLRERGIGFVLAVARDHRVHTHAGVRRAIDLAVTVPHTMWQTRSAGPGSKGHRWYAWALVDVDDAEPGEHRLLIRRNLRTGELAFYRCWSPDEVPLAALVRVAGMRWRIEENIQAGKGLAALDEHQVRRWTSWQRWTILAMLAHAFLAVLSAAERTTHAVTDELIPLTCNEIRHLLVSLTGRTRHTIEHVVHWSRWRRRQQARAKASHYRRRQAAIP
jgi:SRSO17 transposase